MSKLKALSAEIIVTGKQNKPYFQIKYFDLSDNKIHIGFGSYKLDFVFEWLKDEIEIIEIKNTQADKIRQMNDEELAEFIQQVENNGYSDSANMPYDNADSILDWLKGGAE